jgi:hypothetical protein
VTPIPPTQRATWWPFCQGCQRGRVAIEWPPRWQRFRSELRKPRCSRTSLQHSGTIPGGAHGGQTCGGRIDPRPAAPHIRLREQGQCSPLPKHVARPRTYRARTRPSLSWEAPRQADPHPALYRRHDMQHHQKDEHAPPGLEAAFPCIPEQICDWTQSELPSTASRRIAELPPVPLAASRVTRSRIRDRRRRLQQLAAQTWT